MAAPRITRGDVHERAGRFAWRALEYEIRKTCFADDWLKAALSDSATASVAHLCGECGSPAIGKGMVCLWGGYAPQSGGKCLAAFV